MAPIRLPFTATGPVKDIYLRLKVVPSGDGRGGQCVPFFGARYEANNWSPLYRHPARTSGSERNEPNTSWAFGMSSNVSAAAVFSARIWDIDVVEVWRLR